MIEGVNWETPEGQRLFQKLHARLDELRVRNDNTEMSDKDTHVTRGAIQEIKMLLTTAPPKTKSTTYSFPNSRDRG